MSIGESCMESLPPTLCVEALGGISGGRGRGTKLDALCAMLRRVILGSNICGISPSKQR
jgi:hypothetical protein